MTAPHMRGGGGEGTPDPAGPCTGVMALPHTDWLYHHLTVAGPPAEVAAFRAAAAGAGVIPWAHGLAEAAEDWAHMLAAPPPERRTIGLEGARILAGRLRDAAEARMRLVAERSPAVRACPLDLHRLLPVPARLLRLGPAHPDSLAWLWGHWGTTQALRHVLELPVPKRGQAPRRDPGLLRVSFWSADWTPWRAVLALRARWPGLRLEVRPLYDDP